MILCSNVHFLLEVVFLFSFGGSAAGPYYLILDVFDHDGPFLLLLIFFVFLFLGADAIGVGVVTGGVEQLRVASFPQGL